MKRGQTDSKQLYASGVLYAIKRFYMCLLNCFLCIHRSQIHYQNHSTEASYQTHLFQALNSCLVVLSCQFCPVDKGIFKTYSFLFFTLPVESLVVRRHSSKCSRSIFVKGLHNIFRSFPLVHQLTEWFVDFQLFGPLSTTSTW